VGSRVESDNPGTWTEPRQAPVLRSIQQVAALRADRLARVKSVPPQAYDA